MSLTLPKVETSSVPVSSLNGAGILIIDEDPAFQLGLKTYLKDYVGFREVFVAKSGAEALQLLENEKSIEIVTLDYQMPGMNGIEVLRRLNAAPPHPLSVMMITGYPSDDLEEEFKNLGTGEIHTTHFLSKPVEFEDLESLVLESHTQMKEARELAAAIAAQEAQRAAEEESARLASAAGSTLPESLESDTTPVSPAGPSMTGFSRDASGPISPIAAATLMSQRDPTEPIPVIETKSPDLTLQLKLLNTKVSDLEEQIRQMNYRTPSLQDRFWLNIVTLILIAAVGFIVYQMGIFEKVTAFLDAEVKPPAPAVEDAAAGNEEAVPVEETPSDEIPAPVIPESVPELSNPGAEPPNEPETAEPVSPAPENPSPTSEPELEATPL